MIFLAAYQIYKQQSRNRLEMKSRDKVDEITNHLHLSRGIPNVNSEVTPNQEAEK